MPIADPDGAIGRRETWEGKVARDHVDTAQGVKDRAEARAKKIGEHIAKTVFDLRSKKALARGGARNVEAHITEAELTMLLTEAAKLMIE